MGTVTRSHTFTSGEILTAANLNGEINGLVSAVNGNLDANNVDTSAIPTLTATQTLTNKTLTAPKIGTSILDTNGNELFLLTATGSAVNEFTLANAATSGSPTLSATGGDSNIDITLTPKGTGQVVITTDLKITGDDLYMNTNTSGHILVADGTNYNPVAVSGDVTIASSGAVTIASGAVDYAMIASAAIKDEDNMASNSASHLATQQSIKAYVDSQIATEDTIDELNDTNITLAGSGHVLIYDGSNSWDNKAISNHATLASDGQLTISNDVITNAMMADDAIDTPQIADDAITAALIDDNAVGTAAIASSTTLTTPTLTSPVINVTGDVDGDIYYRASGAFARLAKGTAGQVLKMNSGATAPEWGAATVGGASNLTGLSDVTINSVADKQILIYDGTSNVFENHLLSQDLAISNEGAVTIANDAITSAKIADDAIITALIADDAITTALIADDAITTALIADDAITSALIADDAITSALIADDAITSALIADDAITTALIADDAITNALMADDAINTAQIADGAITNALVNGSAAIAQSKLNLAITTSEIAGATLVTASEGIGSNNNETTIPTSAAVKAYSDAISGVSASSPAFTADMTIYEASANSDPTLSLGTSATNRLLITSEISDAFSSQELDAVTFSTVTAASAAHAGKFDFAVDEVTIATIDDDGINIASGKAFEINGTSVLNATTLGSAVVGSSLTSVGNLSNLSVSGGSTNGVYISQGDIAIKNGGTQSTVKFYCESSNAHYAQIQAPAHSAFSGNVTLTLPASTDTLIGRATTDTLTNKTWNGAVIASAYLDADTAHLSGTQTFTGNKTFTGTVTTGVDDTGVDVKFFGASAGAYMLWDESADTLEIRGKSADSATSQGTLLLSTALNNINDNDRIGQIDFQTPLESGDSDSRLVGARIHAEAEDTFSATVNSTAIVFSTNTSAEATERFRITSAGAFTGAGDIESTSDIRTKENIKPIENALEIVSKIRGVTFNKKDTPDKESVGVIAQEVEEAGLTQAVSENHEGMKTVAYGNMVGLLIEAVKEQQKEIDRLKEIVNA